MPGPPSRSQLYEDFKSSFLDAVPGTVDASQLKTQFKSSITARRRYERIRSLSDLVEVLENQLVIFPDRGIIQAYKIIAESLSPPRLDLAASVDQAQSNLNFRPSTTPPVVTPPQAVTPPRRDATVATPFQTAPPPHWAVQPAPPLQPVFRGHSVPDEVVTKIANTFDQAGGRDWENFATGLGYKIKNVDRDAIRIRQGEVDQIDRNRRTTREKLNDVFNLFEERCFQRNVQLRMLEHICDILRSKEIFGIPYNRLAKQISPSSM